MRAVMRDVFISEAVLQTDNSDAGLKPMDSVDLHTRTLGRYGYTLEDMRFTVREMSKRKSNPLPNLLEQVAADIKRSSEVAQARYRQLQRFDSVAQVRTADTVFSSDTVLRGKLDGYRFVYTGPVPKDSAVAAGTYRLVFDYSTGKHAGSYTKSVRSRMTNSAGRVSESTLWLPVAVDTTRYGGEITVRPDTRQLEVSLSETPKAKGATPDTCYLADVRLVYVLDVRQARAAYLRQLTEFPSLLKAYYEKRYFDILEERGGPVPPRAGR